MTRAGIYARISDDRDGRRLGVKRQETDCRKLAQHKGWTVVDLFVDNDVGAYHGRPRPQYRRLLQAVRDHDLDAIVIWHLDRLTRRPIELEEFLDTCDAAGFTHFACCTGDVDLGTHDGRLMARILGAVARKESDDKSRRVTRKHLELAERGIPVGGTRPYGYEDDKVTIDPTEAAIIREAVARVLTGESIRAITTDLNRRTIPAPRKGPWTQTAIRRILLSPRNAGHRTLRGEIVTRGAWTSILDETTWQHVRAVLLARRGAGNTRAPARTHLLTGFLHCGRCGARLRAGRHKGRRPTYLCHQSPGKNACGRLRIVAGPLEELVTAMILHRLNSPALATALADQDTDTTTDELLAQIHVDEATLEQLSRDHYADKIIGRTQFLAASRTVTERLERTRRRLASAQLLRPVRDDGPELAARWSDLDLERRRTIIDTLIERIVIQPSIPGRNHFDPSRVEVHWQV